MIPRPEVRRRVREFRRRLPNALRTRWHRVRGNAGLILQSALAAAISWWLALHVLDQSEPVFAPIAAVGTLASGRGQRLRNTAELVLGVALGVAIGDAVIAAIGAGWWQLGLVVAVAIATSFVLGGGPALVTQAASTAVLIATLSPPTTTGIYASRFAEALLGGMVSLAVMIIAPMRPLTLVRSACDPVLDTLITAYADAGAALAERNRDRANAALERLRGSEDALTVMREALQAGQETAALAPVHWSARTPLRRYVHTSEFLMRAVRNGRVLTRRCVTALDGGEPIPEKLASTIATLSDAVRVLQRELAHRAQPLRARERLLDAASDAGEAYAAGIGFSGSVIIAQVRATAIDLLQATGIGPEEANVLVREAAKRRAPHQPRD